MKREYGMDVEYDVILNSERNLEVLQYPLSEEHVELVEIKGKDNGNHIEASVSIAKPKKELKMKGIASSTINDYYVLSVGQEEIVGERVRNIVQLRPMVEEKQDPNRTEKKESQRVFATNETTAEVESRVKNPNYQIEKLLKEPWIQYRIELDRGSVERGAADRGSVDREAEAVHGVKGSRNIAGSISKAYPHSSRKSSEKLVEDIERAVYNARVVNKSVLHELFPEAPLYVVKQVLSKMTEKIAGRYLLKKEYFEDMSDTYEKIVQRMEKSRGELQLTLKEITDPEEVFMYVLQEISHRSGSKYVLKGRNEQ